MFAAFERQMKKLAKLNYATIGSGKLFSLLVKFSQVRSEKEMKLVAGSAIAS